MPGRPSRTSCRKICRVISPQCTDRVPLGNEPAARGLVRFLGGERGRHVRTDRSLLARPLPFVVCVAYIFVALGYLSKAACLTGTRKDGGSVALNWDGNRQYAAACYSDIVPLYSGRGMDTGGFPYAYSWTDGGATRYMEYPVLSGLFQGLMGFISRATYGLVEWATVPAAGWYFAVTALCMSVMWVGTIVLACRLAGARVWDILLVAASPLVIVHAFTNWDIPAIFLAVAGLYAAARHRNAWAGVLFGLGAAFKLWPVFLLGAFFVLAVRARATRSFMTMLLGAVGAWLVVNVPIARAYPEAWGEFFRLNSERSWEWTTIYAVLDRTFGLHPPITAVNAFSFGAFLACCAGIFALGVTARRVPRVAELVLLILVAFLLFNKVWSPQYSLWLVVPAVLALPRWRLLLCWMLADALVWPILMWHMLGAENKGLPQEFLDIAVLVRDGFLVAIAVLVLRQMLSRSQDKVYAAHHGRDVMAGDFAQWSSHSLGSHPSPASSPRTTPSSAGAIDASPRP
ncbi:glycosyltransferase 87 family protein [Corynebacterium massiliense]|uniref:glycosyltransferase family 87 protein n=1 Tax=Corynebacterium massiliense TaxID=441501 RepID=UPI0009FC6982